MKLRILLSMLAVVFVFSAAYAAKHPVEISASQDCAECHAEVTPDVVQQWEQSAHGFTGVKCGVCHGDVQSFKAAPSNDTCRGCHSKQVEMNVMPDKDCSSCHPVHTYNVHKQKDYK